MAEETQTPTGLGAGAAMAESPQTIMQRGLDQAAAEAPAEPEDPWAAFGDEARELADKKGWKSPSDLIKGYTELERFKGQRDEEKEGLLAELARMEAQRQQAPPPAQQQQPTAQVGGQELNFDALAASCVDPNTGEMNYGALMSLASALGARMAFDAAEARMSERFAQFETERVQPLTQAQEQARIEQELEQIADFYGDDYASLEQRIEGRLKSDPGWLDRFGSLQGAFAHEQYEVQREQRQEAAQAADAHTIRGAGRRPQEKPQSPEERELAMMQSYMNQIPRGL